MLNTVCIAIPVYKPFEQLKPTEQVAWQQCLRVLGSYTICLIHPSPLDVRSYMHSLAAAGVARHSSFAFPAAYFADIYGYNRLMLSRELYQRFAAYEYMLLYQLDAYVFEDRLPDWCLRNYSYVGAPWFKGFVPAEEEAELWQIGNGGFSLRRIPDFLRVLSSFAVLRPWSTVIREHLRQHAFSNWKMLPSLGKRLLTGNNTYWRFNDYTRYANETQEDYFWGVECPQKFAWYKVPSPQEALAFGFEVYPRKMYVLNENKLPMGCHAWEKYEPEFWKEFIK